MAVVVEDSKSQKLCCKVVCCKSNHVLKVIMTQVHFVVFNIPALYISRGSYFKKFVTKNMKVQKILNNLG